MNNGRARFPSQPSPRPTSEIHLTYPFREEDVRKLPLGATLSISGTIYTGRDRLHRYLADGGQSPVDLHDGAIYHCGPIVIPDEEQPAGWRIVAAGPTTSSRENPYMPKIIREHGLRLLLGKGGMNPETQKACRENGCVYVQVVGGAAAWLARCIRRVEAVWFLDDFGATEAMWKLEVEDLPGIVAIDANGESLFSSVEQLSRKRLKELIGSPLRLDRKVAGHGGPDYTQPNEPAGLPPPLNVVFMGSADVSCEVLRALHDAPRVTIQGVVTQPDKPRGRNRKLMPCLAKEEALSLGLPVISPEKVNAQEVRDTIAKWRPDVIIVVAYGQFLGSRILSMPPLGCLNVHLSLLPRYRGAAPVQRAVESGDKESGVTIMKMDHGMDSGDIIMQRVEPTREDDTAGDLHDRLSKIGAELLIECLPKWRSGLITPRAQRAEDVTFANKLNKDEARLFWLASAETLATRIRAFNPWPVCYAYFENRRGDTTTVERLQILRARAEKLPEGTVPTAIGTVVDISAEGPAIATADGMLRLLEVKRPGGKKISGAAFLCGCPLSIGQLFDARPPTPENP